MGIDPGTRCTGYCILKNKKIINYGLLKLNAKASMPERIEIFYDFFKKKFEHYNVDILAIETPFLYKNAATYLKLGYLRSILYLLSRKYNTSIKELAPCQVKQGFTGYGAAKKTQIAQMAYKLFPTLEKDLKDDVTDAIAIAYVATRSG